MSKISPTSCGIAPTTAFTRATAPFTTEGSKVDSISGNTAIIFGANCVTRFATPSKTLLIRGIRLSPAITRLSTNSSIRLSKSAVSDVIPVKRFVQLALTDAKDPEIVSSASFAVVPVISKCF